MDLQNTLRELFAGRRVENNTQSSEPAPPAPAPPAVEEEEEGCTVCLMPMENPYKMPCGHEICLECKGQMMTQNLGNGCVCEHRETGIKVIKCPICRRDDVPTREELIAEIVRIRRGGNFNRIYAPRVPNVPVQHNLPAVIPVLQPVILNPQPAPAPRVIDHERHAQVMQRLAQQPQALANPAPAPAPAPRPIVAFPAHPLDHLVANTNFRDGMWLRRLNPQPIADVNYWQLHGERGHYNVLNGYPARMGQEWDNGQRIAGRRGVILGQDVRRFYAYNYLVPTNTQGRAVPARRVCPVCVGNHERRTARRCGRGCGEFICVHCNCCNNAECQELNH